MTRGQAAQILGLVQPATPSEVTAAFRRQARRVHPDTKPGAATAATAPANMAALVEARDLLLSAPPRPDEQRDDGPPSPEPPPNPYYPDLEEPWWSGLLSKLVVAASLAFLMAGVAVVSVVGWGLLGGGSSGDETPASTEPTDADTGTDRFSGCVVIFQTSENLRTFQEADCSTPNTWKISSWTEGLAACPATEEAVRNAEGTWCLTPPEAP